LQPLTRAPSHYYCLQLFHFPYHLGCDSTS
jgi:hypothetical protein